MSSNKSIIEKISLIKKYETDPENEFIGCWFSDVKEIKKEEFSCFKKQYPFLDDLYLEFLYLFGGATISWIDILPLHDTKIPDIENSLASLQEHWDHSEGYLPFAEDGGDYIYCFDKEAKVWGFSLQGYDEKPDFFANSFEEFINECVLGKRYEEFLQTKDSPFYDFLKKQGWV